MKSFKATSLVQQLLFNKAQVNKVALISLSTRGIKNPPKFNEDDVNKINSFNGDLAAYFEDLMRRRPHSTGGYINLPQENFKLMIDRS